MAKRDLSWISYVILFVLLVVVGGMVYWGRTKLGPVAVDETDQDLYAKGPYEATVEEVVYSGEVKGFYAYPSMNGEYPGVVMIHEWWGLNENIKDMARILATNGYRVLAVDLYGGRVATVSSEASMFVAGVNEVKSVENMKDAVKYLKDHGVVRIGSLGWCFGGGRSLALALSGEEMNATVIYYGTPLETDPVKLSVIKWPVLGIFGDKDQAIPIDMVMEFEKSLNNLGIENEIYIYPGMGHAFANPTGQNFAGKETKDAWEKTVVFLNRYLGT